MTRPLILLALWGAIGGAALAVAPARAAVANYSSYVSEVDACNRAQLPLPATATVTGMRVRTGRQGNTVIYSCSVNWTDRSGATPSGKPILF